MKSPFALLMTLALLSPLAAFAVTSHAGHPAAHAEAPQKMTLNAGKKWRTDDTLRHAMTNIRTAVSQTLPKVHTGSATAADYDAFGKIVAAQITHLLENCKLEPKADAQLHIVLADMLSGVEAAEGKQGANKRASGVVKMAQAANAYGKHFDHPGWRAIKVPHSLHEPAVAHHH